MISELPSVHTRAAMVIVYNTEPVHAQAAYLPNIFQSFCSVRLPLSQQIVTKEHAVTVEKPKRVISTSHHSLKKMS